MGKKRKGSLLEQNVANIFSSLGFSTETNVKKKGYEIDVFAKKGNFEIIIECKQYENSSLTIRNLIHQWADKNAEIKADRVLVVLYGLEIKDTDLQLALSRNIILWDGNELQKYTNLVIKNKSEAYTKLISDLNIETKNEKSMQLKNIEEAKKFVMLTLMSGKSIDKLNENNIYENFILSLKNSLQVTLRLKPSKNPEQDKKDYAELFSKAEREGQNAKEKWEKIKSIIQEDDKTFPKGKVKEAHLEAIKKIETIFEESKQYFNEKNKKNLREKLIKTALEYLKENLEVNIMVFMSKENKSHTLTISFEEDDFNFLLNKKNLSSDKLEKLDWIIEEPKQNSSEKEEMIVWSMESNINKATKCVETIFKEIFNEDEQFDIVLEGLYVRPSWVAFWILLIFGIITLMWVIGILFIYLAYREYKKNKQ